MRNTILSWTINTWLFFISSSTTILYPPCLNHPPFHQQHQAYVQDYYKSYLQHDGLLQKSFLSFIKSKAKTRKKNMKGSGGIVLIIKSNCCSFIIFVYWLLLLLFLQSFCFSFWSFCSFIALSLLFFCGLWSLVLKKGKKNQILIDKYRTREQYPKKWWWDEKLIIAMRISATMEP